MAAASVNEADKAAEWARRLDETPDIDIDYWTLLWEARIVQAES